jgi:hypothetical protein
MYTALPFAVAVLYCPTQMFRLAYPLHTLDLALQIRTSYRDTVGNGNVTFPVGNTGSVKLTVGRPAVGKLVMIGVLVRRGGMGAASHG